MYRDNGKFHQLVNGNFCTYVLKKTPSRPVTALVYDVYGLYGCWNGWISDNYCSLKPLCSGMEEVVPARTSPTLLPPSPRTVLSLSCFKVYLKKHPLDLSLHLYMMFMDCTVFKS